MGISPIIEVKPGAADALGGTPKDRRIAIVYAGAAARVIARREAKPMQINEEIATVRPERPRDYAAIAKISRAAFGQDNEARLVARLRELAGFDPGLSLVAVRDDVVVGHILFSPIVIASEANEVPALALAPMAVLPALQRE